MSIPEPKGLNYSEAPKPVHKDGFGVIYIFHYWSYKTGMVKLFIDGKEIASLADGEYTWVQLPIGEYTLTSQSPWIKEKEDPNFEYKLIAKDRESSFYKFSNTLASSENTSGMSITFVGGMPIPGYQTSYRESSKRVVKEYNELTGTNLAKRLFYNPPIENVQ